MLLKLEQNPALQDIEVSIEYPEKNKKLERIVSFIHAVDSQIECYSDNSIKLINVSDIYCVESIDNKTIVFCEKEKFPVKSRLYQIYEQLTGKGFIQISKYCILNIHKLEKFTPLFNSCMEATLSNGIRQKITRKYIAGIKRIMREESR